MRKAFVQKVYGIVATQLAATGAVVAFLRSMPHVPFEILRRLGPLFFLLPLGPLLMLQLMPNTRTSGSASAYLLLAAFTILQATVIGVATLGVPLQLVLRAATVTAVATGGLSLYALTTRRDFTMAGGLLVSGIIALFSLSVLQFFFGGSPLASLRLALGTVIFCAYLVYNTQMMMGGGKKRQLRPDEHILAAAQVSK